MIDTRHLEMLKERDISMEMVDLAMTVPDRVEDMEDGTKHFLKQFDTAGGRWLRVIVNIKSAPPRRITAFFDKRLRRKQHENKSG
ncbi:MAG: DUF4258 domain-containing protein [Desulfotignum sp.]|jgi:hypothetical protein|nr:DUF4258 domain-containing protein [Desulfotignum sp.]